MHIKLNPRVSGGLVHRVMSNQRVSSLIEKSEIDKDMVHDLVKSILIAGFNYLDVDVNKDINDAKDQVSAAH